MYDILFLSRLIPKETDGEVRSRMSNTMDDAANAWQYHIIEGLEAHLSNPVKLLNYLPVKSYPHNYKDAFVKGYAFSHTKGAKDVNLPFCNMKYIKRLLQGRSLYKEVLKWARKDDGKPKWIIAYTLYPEYLKAIIKAKRVNPSIRALAIVLDLPEYSVLTNRTNTYTQLYLKWNKREVGKKIQCIDRFVLLTDPMTEALGIVQPYTIVEGICTQSFPKKITDSSSLKQVFYAGTLHERFGVRDLICAFEKIPNPDYRLVLCGYGDLQDYICDIASKDSRIEYKGQLHRDDVLALMRQATVIVNPRGNNEVFTKYSFPSKNIEALSSGIPFVGQKLAGIPAEYDAYINYPRDASVDALADAIIEVCEDVSGIYTQRANKAMSWVLENKNPKIQARKVLDLMGRV